MQSIDSILRSQFGLQAFRPHQREIIESVLAAQDCVCIMPTGAGKSLCFQVPAVALDGLTVVISPLISLMADQVRQLRVLKIPAHFLNSSQSWDDQRHVFDDLRRGFRGLLYLAPERLAAESFQRILPQLKPRLLVIDEAHCVSHWGHDFRPEYKRIADLREQLGSPVTMALTATATPDVRKDIVRMLKLRTPKMFVTGFDRPNLTYAVQRCETELEKDAALLRFLKAQPGSGIIYCSTRKAVESVAEMLREKLHNRTIAAYHAGFNQDLRARAQRLFISDPNAIAIATNAFGMGINKPETRFVVHYNLPGSLEAYYQEAGRAGRDGDPAQCLLFFNQRDVRTQEWFIRNIGDNNPQLKPDDIARLQEQGQKKLDKMHAFAAQWKCRRKQVLEYFGESAPVHDCRCDVCARGSVPLPRKAQVMPVSLSAPQAAVRSKPRKEAPSLEQLDAAAQTRFDRLKQARAELAREHQLAAFIIAHDSALRSVATDCPRTLAELALVRGFGAKKVERFGEAFLKALHGDAPTPVLRTRELQPRLPLPKQPLAQPRPTPKPAVAPITGDLISRLLSLRERLASEHRLPPYFVLRDSTLHEIARTMPVHLNALSAINGVGEKKAHQFGAAILDTLHG